MIEFENAGYIYPGGTTALDNINITVNKGETVAVVGANGAGKSTLLLMTVGVISGGTGRITVDGTELNKKNLGIIRNKVGMVFQNPDDQLFMPTVYDDIAFGPKNNNISGHEAEEVVNRVAKELGITHLIKRAPHRLSGGEKRLAAIATVLSMNPSVLLFDEPTSFLDPKARRNLIMALKKIRLTKIIATHDLDMALDVCDRVIVLKEGSVFSSGKPAEILTDETLLDEAGLELPLSIRR